MKYVVPGLILSSGLNVNLISHDKTIVDNYKKDPLVHGKISVSLFVGAIAAAKYALTHAYELKVPTLIIHGSDDMITSLEGSREFAGKTNMVDFKIWDAAYHELHNEQFRDEVFKYILNWINRKQS